LSRDNQSLFVGLIDGQIQKWNMTQAPPKWTFQSNDGNSTITSVCALDQVSYLRIFTNVLGWLQTAIGNHFAHPYVNFQSKYEKSTIASMFALDQVT
jgi:hypothetical protein